MAEHDPVNHPTHYASDALCSGCGTPIECIDVVRHMGFDQGNAIKYLWRAGKKDAAVQDLKKAIWYIQDMIHELENTKNPNVHRLSEQEFDTSKGDWRKAEAGRVEAARGVEVTAAMGRTEDRQDVEDSKNVRNTQCVYTFEQNEYLCITHGMKQTKHHPSVGASRPCIAVDPLFYHLRSLVRPADSETVRSSEYQGEE